MATKSDLRFFVLTSEVPEATPEAKPEASFEATPEATPEASPEVTGKEYSGVSLEIHFHFHQFECLSLSFVPEAEGLREKGHLGSQRGVVSLHYGGPLGRLRQPAGAERRLEQPGAGNHF